MTAFDRFDPFERRISSAIDEIAGERQPHYLDDIFQVTARSKQRPRWQFPERWINVNRLTLAAAAAAIVLLVGGGALVLTQLNNPGVGGTPTPSPSPTASPRQEAVAMPDQFWGDWHADGVAIPGVTSAQLVRLSVDWQDGKSVWVQLDSDGQGRQVLQSTPVSSGPGGRVTFSSDEGNAGCKAGDIGQYVPHRTADGLFMWFELMGEECEARKVVFTARMWTHSLSAVNDGGVGVIPYQPWIQVTMPKLRFAMSGGTNAADIHTFNDSAPFRSLIFLEDPMGFQAPCETANQPFAIDRTPAAFEDYLLGLPGLQVGASDVTIDGIAGRSFEAVALPGVDCAAGEAWIFRSQVATESDAAWSYSPGDEFFLWALPLNGHLIVFSYDGESITLADAQAIVESIKFMDELPVPAP